MQPLFLSQLKPALKLCWKNRLAVALCGMIDIAFFIALAFAHYEILKRLAGYVQVLMEELQSTLAGAITQEDITQFRPALMKSPEFMSAYHQIAKYMILLLIAVFLAWIIFKSINWYFANKIAKEKISFWMYLKSFTLYSLLWFCGLTGIILLFVSLTSYSTGQMLPLIGQTGTKIITAALLLVLGYFAFVSYSLIPKTRFKEAFKTAVKKGRQIIPAYILTIILTGLVAYIPAKIALLQHPAAYYAVLAFVILITLPALSYGRIYISLVVNKA